MTSTAPPQLPKPKIQLGIGLATLVFALLMFWLKDLGPFSSMMLLLIALMGIGMTAQGLWRMVQGKK